MIEDVKAVVGSAPYMKIEQAQCLQKLMRTHELHDVLELGFMHGVSTCYLADVAKHVTAIDLVKPQEPKRMIESFLDRLGLSDRVTIFYEPTSYTWRLMKMLEEDPTPRFDLVYIDGAHNWNTDGFAFFLADKLLRPGGWIVFDDIPWTYATSPEVSQLPWVLALPEEERLTPQVKRVFDLLVRTHPAYGDFLVEGQWGYAHKMTGAPTGEVRVVHDVEVRYVKYGLGALAVKVAKKVRRR
jgi:predicted O-methyltransferase YrrM